MNQIILTGNLGKDAEKGKYDVRFTIATTRRYKDKGGEYQEKTTWHNVSYIGKNEAVANLRKGQRVCVIGEYDCGTFNRSDGTTANYAQVVSFEVYVEPRALRKAPENDLPDFMK